MRRGIMCSLSCEFGTRRRSRLAEVPRSIALLVLSTALVLSIGFFTPEAGAQESPSAEEMGEVDDVGSAPIIDESTRIALTQFTTAVEDREPVDQVTFVGTDVRKIFLFSDLRGLAGTIVTHNWIYDGQSQAKVDFEVKGPRWRVWSSKELAPAYVGDWTVEIVTEDGEVLASETFTYSQVDD
jgi:Protein of unknown function (DUF2914)